MKKPLASLLLGALLLSSTAIFVKAYADNQVFENFNNPDLVSTDTANEYKKVKPYILNSPSSPSNAVAAYIDLGGCRVSTSSNGGNSWTIPASNQGFIPLPSGITFSADPVLAISGNTWYAACLGHTGEIQNGHMRAIFYSTSTDNGATWQAASVIVSNTCVDIVTDCAGVDKPWIAAAGNELYACWSVADNVYNDANDIPTTFRIKFKRVLPTAGPELELAQGLTGGGNPGGSRMVHGCHIAVNPNVNGANGIVYVLWTHLVGDQQAANSGAVEMKRSFDKGQTVDGLQTITHFTRLPTPLGPDVAKCKSDMGCVRGMIEAGSGQQSGFRSPSFVSAAIDSQNNITLAIQNYRPIQLTDVNYMKLSKCITTSSCVLGPMVNVANDGDIAADQFMPSIVYSPNESAYHIVAFDKRNSAANTHWQPFDYHCHIDTDCNNASNWIATQVTAQASTNIEAGSPTNFIGDYHIHGSSAQLELLASWPDNRLISGLDRIRIFSDRTSESFHVKTGTFAKSTAAAPATQTITGVGFQPKAVLLFTTGQTVTDGSNDVFNLAMGVSSGPANSRSIGVQSDDAAASSNAGRAFGTKLIKILSSGNPTISAEADLTSFDSNGFTLDWLNPPSAAHKVYYLALKGGKYSVGKFDKTTSASPATQTITSTGFRPTGLFFASVNNPTSGSVLSTNRVSLGAGDGFNNRAMFAGDRDNVPDAIAARSSTSSKSIRLATEQATGSSTTINAEAHVVSVDAAGYSLFWTTNNAVANEVIYAAFGEAPTGIEALPTIGYWKLDEGSGVMAGDSSGFNNPAFLVSGAIWLTGSSCKHNNCVGLDGVNDYVHVDDNVPLDGMSELTVSVWIKRQQIGDFDMVVVKGELSGDNTSSYGLWFTPGDTLSWAVDTDTGLWTVVSSSSITDTTALHHLVGTYKSGEIKLYIDGSLTASGTLSGAVRDSFDALQFGRGGSISLPGYFPGNVDQVRLYDVALTETQVQQLYQLGQ